MSRSRLHTGRHWCDCALVAIVWLGWMVIAAPAALAADGDQAALDLPVAIPANTSTLAVSHSPQKLYPLIVGPIVQLGGIRGNISAVRNIEGEVARRTLTVADAGSAKSLDEKLARRLGEAGFDPLYACQGQACGPRFRDASPGHRAAREHFDASPDDQTYRAMRRSDSNGDEYVAVQIAPDGAGLAVQFDIARSRPREIAAISVDAAEMARQLAQKGRVALYGIFFNSDSDRIKPESQATVGQIAQLLANQPKLRLLVVGHTDNQGSFAYNQTLSEHRAEAVVDALVQRHHVNSARLKALGVSYAAPSTSNVSAAGRAKNRRVELVPW